MRALAALLILCVPWPGFAASPDGPCHCWRHETDAAWMKGCREVSYPHGGPRVTVCRTTACRDDEFKPTAAWTRIDDGAPDCLPCRPACGDAGSTLPRGETPDGGRP